jgi:hypothetical protein
VPYAELDDDGKRIRVSTRYLDRDRMREIPGANWSTKDNIWKLPLGWSACVTLRGVFGNELEVGPKLTEWAEAEYRNRIQPAEAMRELVAFIDAPAAFPTLPPAASVVQRWATRGRIRKEKAS